MMRASVLLACLVIIHASSAALRAQDAKTSVEISLRGVKDTSIQGIIAEESIAGIRLLGRKEIIPAENIGDVNYVGQLPIDLRSTYRLATEEENIARRITSTEERNKKLAGVMAKYQEVLEKAPMDLYAARRHIEYKLAHLQGIQGAGSQELLPRLEAIKRLQAFKTKYPDSWQYTRVMMELAQLQAEQDRLTDAKATLNELMQKAVLPSIKQDAQLQSIRLDMKAGKHKEALKLLKEAAATFPPGSPQQIRASIAEAECLTAMEQYDEAAAALQKVLKATPGNPELHALAYLALGECYFKAERLQEARWPFLWVEVVYNQDREQHAKALYYLWRIFDRLSEFERARDFQRTLLNSPELAGTEYQRRAAAEKGS